MAFASRFIDTVGDGTGSTSLNVDGSVTPVIFRIKPLPGEALYLCRLIWFLEDNGSIDSGGFGNGAALTNGVLFQFVKDVSPGNPDGTPIVDPTFRPIKTNLQWAAYCYDVSASNFGQGNEGLAVRYTFSRDVNGNIGDLPYLADANKEEFQIVIQDDLTSIVDITCRIGMYSR